jgi:hypothetical protein
MGTCRIASVVATADSVCQVQATVAQWEGQLVRPGPSRQACTMMAKEQSTALLLARSTAGTTSFHKQPRGTCATRICRLSRRTSQRSWSPEGSARSSSISWQARVALLSVFVV